MTLRRALAGGLTLAALSATLLSAQPFELPTDPSAAVITLDFRGDRLVRINEAPTLSILADGRVVLPQSYAHTQAYEGRISVAELQDLVQFIVSEQSFLELDTASVRSEISTARRQPLPVHASTTAIGINLRNRSHQVVIDGLSKAPRTESAARLLAIQARLDRLMAKVQLGGDEGLAQWLEVANAEMAARDANAQPMSLDDFERGSRRPDGSVSFRFVRRDPATGAGRSVSVEITAAGERFVTVSDNVPAERGGRDA